MTKFIILSGCVLLMLFSSSCHLSEKRVNVISDQSSVSHIKQVAQQESPKVVITGVSQIVKLQEQVWQNLVKVAGTQRDYRSSIQLRIANGDIIDANCILTFPQSSWDIASIIVDDYKDVLKNTNVKVFEVIYRLISDPNILATEIYFNGLWRPWGGSHVHPQGRGIDIGNIRGAHGSGVVYNTVTSAAENDFGKAIRESLTTGFPAITQYLSPWYKCNPPNPCAPNTGSDHRDHLHLTLRP